MTTGNPFLDADLARIKANFDAIVSDTNPKPVQCFSPPKPWHIVARENAKRFYDELKKEPRSWGRQNIAEGWLREAIRMHRFQRGNSAVQTFGSVL